MAAIPAIIKAAITPAITVTAIMTATVKTVRAITT